MTEPRIATSTDGLQFRVDAVGERRAALLNLLGACSDGDCACASDEYRKVESMQLDTDAFGVTVSVRTKPGERIDPSCVTECLGQLD